MNTQPRRRHHSTPAGASTRSSTSGPARTIRRINRLGQGGMARQLPALGLHPVGRLKARSASSLELRSSAEACMSSPFWEFSFRQRLWRPPCFRAPSHPSRKALSPQEFGFGKGSVGSSQNTARRTWREVSVSILAALSRRNSTASGGLNHFPLSGCRQPFLFPP